MSKRKLSKKIIILIFFLWALGFNSASYAFSLSSAINENAQSDSLRDVSFWRELRAYFALNHESSKSDVREQIQWVLQNQYYLSGRLEKAAPYLYFIFQQVKQRKLPGELVLLPLMESAYNPFIYSKRGAAGLWQLMPRTATDYGVKQNRWYDGRRDVFASTNAALDYLTNLNTSFNGEWLLTIAAYDSGAGTIQQAIRNNMSWGPKNRFWSLALPHETKIYVPRLLALATIVEHPERYGFKLPAIKNEPYFDVVKVNSQIELSHAAKLSGASLKELYQLNPGFNHFATRAGNGPHRLLIPIDKVAAFKQNLAKAPKSELSKPENQAAQDIVYYYVKQGDSLYSIAHKFHTSIAKLRLANNSLHKILQIKQRLQIPV